MGFTTERALLESPQFKRNQGKWLAYTSDETGRAEVYIRPFPSGTGKWLISTNGGTFSRWRHDGKELFYLSALNGGKLIAAEIRAAGSFIERGTPRELFDSGYVRALQQHTDNYYPWAVSPDGQRFLIPRSATNMSEITTATSVTVVVNWTAALSKK